MNKIGWKVVRTDADGTLVSAVLRGDWSRPYAVGSRTTGCEGTPVLAFRTRQAARRFKTDDLSVFKARLENPRPQVRLMGTWFTRYFRDFWMHPGYLSLTMLAPDDTLVCDAITLLERA